MKCVKCLNTIEPNAKFCGKCGSTIEQTISQQNLVNGSKINFFIVPTWRVILFSILSFGIYSMYWFTKNFKAIESSRKSRGKKTNPIFWGIFNNLCSEILFKEIDLIKRSSKGKGLSINPTLLGVIYFISLLIFSNIFLGPVVVIFTILKLQSIFKDYSKIGICTYEELDFSWKEVAISVLGILIIVVSFFAGIISNLSDTNLKDSNLNTTTQTDIIEANKDLPYMVDSETRLNSIQKIEKNLIYNYSLINYTKDQLSGTDLNKTLKADIVKSLCSDKDLKILIQNNFKFNYDYYDKNNTFLERISIDTNTDCLRL